MPLIKQRVNLARKLDIEVHRVTKDLQDKNWFIKTAKEADLELDHHTKAAIGQCSRRLTWCAPSVHP